uniref:CSON013613 protein n=1 Tax=Culicoides sonorensis TaxID=179676 RepID=A0A336M8K9_CULSO
MTSHFIYKYSVLISTEQKISLNFQFNMALVLRNILNLSKRAVYCQISSKHFSTSDKNGDPKETEGKEGTEEQVEKIPENIIVEKCEGVTLIGINRPEKRNCVNRVTASQLITAINEFESDEKSTVGVLYGVGGSFCAGFDLSEVLTGGADAIINTVDGAMGPTRSHTKKPLIAAINGYCVGGGLELALMCDLRIVEENSVLGFFNRRFGVPLVDGGCARIARLIGLSRALDLVLTGRHVSAKEAFEIGLANRMVAIGASLGQAVNLANSIAKFPPECLKHDRDALYYATYDSPSFSDAINYEVMTCSKELFDEATQGSTKFVDEGIGRGGKFHDVRDKDLPEWEKDEIKREIKNEEATKKEKE